MAHQAANLPERHSGPRDDDAPEPGWAVLHLFCDVAADVEADAVDTALARIRSDGYEVVTTEILGHKGDLGVLALGPSFGRLRALQSELRHAGCAPRYSYVSLTEVSEYARHVPAAARQARLRPKLPPAQLPAFCFYPMSRRRDGDENWYRLPYEERLRMMMNHGKVGSTFRGRVVQLVTGSTGLDDWEWGVTLFATTFDDIKSCVSAMRYDEASARYTDFGPFVTGVVSSPAAILAALVPTDRTRR